MPLSKLVFKPGINRDQTDYASEGGWYEMDKVRFRSGFPEKIGGWTVRTLSAYEGVARSLFTWATTDGGKLIGIGTNQKMYVSSGSNVYDITPLRVTYTSTTVPSSSNCFKTTNGSNQVEILTITAGIEEGEWVTFDGVDAFNGIPKSDFLTKSSTPGVAISTITRVTTTATLTTSTAHGLTSGTYVTVSGATPAEYNVSEKQITVTGANTFTYVMASTPASSATIVGSYLVDTFSPREFKVSIVGSAYTITVDTAATSSGTGGGTAITAEFQVNIGQAVTTLGYGWGAGFWSRGSWGSGSEIPIFLLARLQFQDNFNNDLVFNYSQGDIYYWAYDPTYLSRAVTLTSIPGAIAVPRNVSLSLFSSSGHYVALGCTNYQNVQSPGVTISTMTRGGTGNLTATVTTTTAYGLQSGDSITVSGTTPAEFNGTFQITYIDATHFSYTMATAPSGNATVVGTYVYNNYTGSYDPLLIRWANVDPDTGPQPEVWKPELTNTAGFLRIQSGSAIVAAVNTRQEMLILTDTSATSMQYLGTAEVFGLQEMAHNISIAGSNTIVAMNNIVYWMGRDKFFTYSGRVDTLPCTLRQYIFSDINNEQSEIFFAGTNNQFNEIIWFYCSANSINIDRYVIYNYSENIWYYGHLDRTAWLDSGEFTIPISAYDGWVYNQETGVDDGQPLSAPALPIEAYIKSADVDIDDGDKYMLIRRIIPDVNFRNSTIDESITPQVDITVGVRNFPGAANSVVNSGGIPTVRDVVTTATIDQYTNQVFVRARGRQLNFKISSDTLGTQWQLGMPRVDARPDGRRN